MSELRFASITMPGAELGPENPLPPLRRGEDVHAEIAMAPDVPPDVARNVSYGHVRSILPYSLQDGYARDRRPMDFRVAALENEVLRATFLLDYGGRLWSLLHKPSGRELLDRNPVFQPANLAIRNAWFAGGVEWNIGTIGHSPFTCSPLFAARVAAEGGAPALRLYEYERIRGVPFQIDAWLPDGSPVLLVRTRIVNPHDRTIPMYWWSNIAVPEAPDVRVVVPADRAFQFDYKGKRLGLVPIPEMSGTNVTYPTRMKRAADFFFRVPDGARPWIAALDGDGRGLVQTSTALLRGRKLFVWGTGPGGRTWQAFLSDPGHAYIEIQAGLARTQMEHLPMPPGEWSWLEAYGLLEADSATVHGSDWQAARDEAARALEALVGRADLDRAFERADAWKDRPPEEIVRRGAGWGALERVRREAAGERPFASDATPFDEASLGPEQGPWLGLLREGAMPEPDAHLHPVGFMVQREWRELLERSVADEGGRSSAAWLHMGLMRYHDGDVEGAAAAWRASLELRRTPWALRNLACLAASGGARAEAADLYEEALALLPGLLPLAAECGSALVEAGRPGRWLDVLGRLPPGVRLSGRVRLLEARALFALGRLDEVEAILGERLVVNDLREGENSLTDLWYALHERRTSDREGTPVTDDLRARVRRERPPPAWMDFRMATGDISIDGMAKPGK